jgi:chemotaxis protein MotB
MRGAPPFVFVLALGFAFMTGACGVPQTQYDAAVGDAKKARAERDEKLAAMQKEIEDLKSKLAEAEGQKAAADEATRTELDELRKQKAASEARLKLLEEFLAKFKSMIDAGKLDITVRRGQIVLALATDILFDTGKTDIRPEGVQTLSDVAEALKGVSGRRFQVDGHTDTLPIKTAQFPSNWELSTARAVSVVKLLIERGVKPDTLSAAGHAEFDPVQSNANEKGRSKNRRIEIVVVPNIEDLVKMPDLQHKTKEPGPEPAAKEPPTKEAPKPKPKEPAREGPKPAPPAKLPTVKPKK